jgi:Spy/CpxP family protein refolding chaperone
MKSLLLCAMIVLSAAATMAQPHPKPGHDDAAPGGGPGIRVLRQLDLTADQKSEFSRLRSELRRQEIGLRASMAMGRVDMEELFRAEKPDKEKIDAALTAAGKLQTEAREARVAFWFDVNKILTADQQKVWKRAGLRFVRQRDEMAGERRGGWLGKLGRRLGNRFPR